MDNRATVRKSRLKKGFDGMNSNDVDIKRKQTEIIQNLFDCSCRVSYERNLDP